VQRGEEGFHKKKEEGVGGIVDKAGELWSYCRTENDSGM